MDDLRDKRVLVTGASSGIGAAVARGFGGAGAAVAVHYNHSKANAMEVVAAIEKTRSRAVFVSGDLAAADGPAGVIDAAAAKLGGLDVLVNNAGSMLRRSAVADADDEYLEALIALNVLSVVRACRHVIPLFKAQGRGTIINTSSIAAWTGGGAGGSVCYAAAKGFINTFTRGLARELASFGIRVNGVAPGLIDTPFHARITPTETMERLSNRIPLGRIGVPADLVGAYLYLASDRASAFVTGTTLEVSGGVVMH